MAAIGSAEERTPQRPSTVAEPGRDSTSEGFRPILFLLSSLTTDNIDAAAVARLLQPRFRPGDFYLVNAAAFLTPNTSPGDVKKSAGMSVSGASVTSVPGSTLLSLKAGVQSELSRIAVAREEARRTATQAKAAQLTALQEEYMDDGLSAEDALEAARAELRERSDSDGDDGEEAADGNGGEHEKANSGSPPLRRLPPCVCVVGVPLTCSAMDHFARAFPGVAAALLLESRCCVRELASSAGTAIQAGAVATTDKAKGRGGGGAGGSATASHGKSGSPYTDDVLEYLSGVAVQLQDDGMGLPDVLLQRVEYPTEGGAAAGVRPSVSPSQFVSSVHALLLRVFQCWMRYESWRDGRACVRVPSYTQLRDVDAAAATVDGAMRVSDETHTGLPEHRLSKRKSAAPSGPIADAASSAQSGVAASAETAATAAQPRSMADIAAERFEYGAFMQRWSNSCTPNTPHKESCAALQACLAACLHQVSCDHGASTLRSGAEASAAQLQEDVQLATEMCNNAYTVGSGGAEEGHRGQALTVAASLASIRTEALRFPFATCTQTNLDTGVATIMEAALSTTIAMDIGGADALSSITAAVASTPGSGDALHWLRGDLVAREQMGWRHTSHRWGPSTTLCCLQRPIGKVHRAAHTAFVFRGPTTFPQFFSDESFLDAEARAYEMDSSSSESEVEEEAEEEDEDEEELEGEESSVDSASTTSRPDSDAPPAVIAKAMKAVTASALVAPAAPLVDHSALVMRQLRRRRVFEQVRTSHARPAVQEMGVSADRRQAVVAETNWMYSADGTVVTMARTAANSCQVRCTVTDFSGTIQGGFMLECPAHVSSATTAPDAAQPPPQQQQQQQIPERTVESGVRGFLHVGNRLRVFTCVEADNSQAVALAAYARAVAAAKEMAAVQYEAQFNKGGKAQKGREKANSAATPLSLDEISAALLAAVPPPPASSAPNAPPGQVSPPLMHVHALFPSHRCVLTPVASRTAVPGVRIAVLPDSAHAVRDISAGSSLATRVPPLLMMHIWWGGQLCTATIRQLSAAHFYVDGVVEIFSPELPAAVRVLLHPSGGYITEVGSHRLFVNARGCCTLYGDTEAADVTQVHQLQSGWATAVTDATVHRFEREDGMQQEFVAAERLTSSAGLLSKTLFGPGVVAARGEGARKWSWRIAGLPVVVCNGATRHVEACLDSDDGGCAAHGGSRWVYAPDRSVFELRVPSAQDPQCSVAATLSLRDARLVLWGGGGCRSDPPHQHGEDGFVVDCAYGGVCGLVQSTHLYRVSPFGRCTEELAVTQGGATQWQLVLPPQYKRPKRRDPEVVLPAQYASEAFHRAVGGTAVRRSDEPTTKDAAAAPIEVLHLQRGPPKLCAAAAGPDADADADAANTRVVGEATENGAECSVQSAKGDVPLSIFAGTAAAAVKAAAQQVRCTAIYADGSTATVMDSASWLAYAQWLARLPAKTLRSSSSTSGAATHTQLNSTLAFELQDRTNASHKLFPLTVADKDAPPAAAPSTQRCVLLYGLSNTALTPSWTTTTGISAALEACVRPHDAVDGAGDSSPMEASGNADNTQCIKLMTIEEPATLSTAEPENAIVEPAKTARAAQPQSPRNRVTGALNYWSSQCCPTAPLPDSPHATPPPRSDGSPTGKSKEVTTGAAHVATAAAESDAGAAAFTAASSATSTRPTVTGPLRVPLMQSYTPAADAHSGTTASSRFHAPAMSVQPRLIDFGNVHKGRRYVATFVLTNTSSVPCRYRVRTSAAVRHYVVVSYPRHFVAPGISVEAMVELSGWQPHGVVDSELSVVHEGGTTEVRVVWCTTDAVHREQLGSGVVCAGWSVSKPVLQHPFKSATQTQETEMEGPGIGEDSDSEASSEMQAV